MDTNKKIRLEEKRKKLQEDIRKKKLKHRLNREIAYLNKNHFKYRINYNHEYLYWMQRHFPIRKKDGYYGMHDFQIDVHDEDKNCTSIYFENHDEIQGMFNKELLKRYNSEEELVICKNGGDPELVISIKALLSNIDFFLTGGEVWFILKNKTLVIEYISGQNSIRFITNQ